jgi:hypothetical protein
MALCDVIVVVRILFSFQDPQASSQCNVQQKVSRAFLFSIKRSPGAL